MTRQSHIDRRRFLQAAGAAATLPLLSSCDQPGSGTNRPPGIPLSAFDGDSTALEVTEGVDLSGKTVLVTGATSGLGLETMQVLALRGAHVIGTGRTLEKAKAACGSVSGRTTPVALEQALGDRGIRDRTDSNARHADRHADLQRRHHGNADTRAGLRHREAFRGQSPRALLLVNRLLEQVKAASQGRVVVVSSLGYQWAPPAGIEFDNLDGRRGYEPNKMYGQSKLANALFSLELARQLREAGSSATSNSVHPGIINTNLGRHFDAWKRVLSKLIGWTFMKSVEAGAATSCYVATAPALAGVSGHYFEDCNPVVPQPGKHMDDLALAARLWQKSTELVGEYLA